MLKIDDASKLALYNKIANAIINEISDGRLQSGSRLPSSRKMAELLNVHRKTVVAAYDELLAQGWIETRGRRGTFIHDKLPQVPPRRIIDSYESKCSILPEPQETFEISFDDGYPDVRLAPGPLLAREYSSLIKNKNFIRSLNYTWEFRGDIQLRQEVCNYLRDTRGIYVQPENILVSRGSIMSFYLAINTFLSPQAHVIVGKPGYQTFNQIVRNNGGQVSTVPVDEEGINVDAVEQICKKQKVSFLYVISHHHHPTTVTLSAERRLRLVSLAKEHEFKIIEDDYDYDFHYESSPVLPLASLHHENHVMYVGSFSKTIAPSLRLGFIVSSADRINQMAETRRYIDRTGDPVLERATAHLLKFGEIQRHLNKALRLYKFRRDLLCDILDTQFSEYISFKKPEGGMAVWIAFNDDIVIDELKKKAKKIGLNFNLPSYYQVRKNTRLGYASLNEREIERGMELMSLVFKK